MLSDKTTAQIRRIFLVISVALSCLAIASAQMASSRKIGDKTVQCLQSGIVTELMDCGLRPFPYDFVFVGSISAITSTEHDELELRIVPEEIFSGKPDSPMTVLTSQRLCFPNFSVGDRWLFYLRKQSVKPIVLDSYGLRRQPARRPHSCHLVRPYQHTPSPGHRTATLPNATAHQPAHHARHRTRLMAPRQVETPQRNNPRGIPNRPCLGKLKAGVRVALTFNRVTKNTFCAVNCANQS